MSSCEICLDTFDQVFTCGLASIVMEKCPGISQICKVCLENYLYLCLSEGRSSKCIVPGCENSYLCFPEELQELGIQVLINYLDKSNQGIIADKISQEKLVQEFIVKRKMEREIFVTRELPEAIRLVAQISFPKRIAKIDTGKIRNASDINELPVCPKEFCSGKLKDMQCLACDAVYCKLCQELVGPGHDCDKNVLANLATMETMSKCPTCHSIIEKNKGCDHMTCRICSSHYSYASGKILPQFKYKVDTIKLKTGPNLSEFLPTMLLESAQFLVDFFNKDSHYNRLVKEMMKESRSPTVIFNSYKKCEQLSLVKKRFYKLLEQLRLKDKSSGIGNKSYKAEFEMLARHVRNI